MGIESSGKRNMLKYFSTHGPTETYRDEGILISMTASGRLLFFRERCTLYRNITAKTEFPPSRYIPTYHGNDTGHSRLVSFRPEISLTHPAVLTQSVTQMRIDCRSFWTMTPYVRISFLLIIYRTSLVYGLCIARVKYRGNPVALIEMLVVLLFWQTSDPYQVFTRHM